MAETDPIQRALGDGRDGDLDSAQFAAAMVGLQRRSRERALRLIISFAVVLSGFALNKFWS
jgi:hypothetical protein